MKEPNNVSQIVNLAKSSFLDDYVLLGMKRQPDTKPRDEEQRLRMIAFEVDIIKRKIDMGQFRLAPKEVMDAYANHKS